MPIALWISQSALALISFLVVHFWGMKKQLSRLIAFFILAILAKGAFAQVAADPNDSFYDDLAVWETMGIISRLPAARPYPMQLVESILQTVINEAPERERRVALAHYKRLFGKSINLGAKVAAALDDDLNTQFDIAFAGDFNHYLFKNFLSISGSFDLWAITKLPDEELLPAYTYSEKDVIADNAHAGPFWILPTFNASVAVGTENVYIIAGMMRGSYGPFHEDNVIVSPSAVHSGQVSFAFRREKWAFNSSFYALSATADADYGSSMDGLSYYPEKFFSIHSLDFHPLKWLSFSFVDAIMYGERLEPMYMLPLNVYFLGQGLTGFSDNSYLGATFTIKPARGWKIDGVFYADDLDFNNIVTFNWNTKWRFAAQLGVSYAPWWGNILSMISLNYTIVTPYTYTHDDSSSANYQNYLHAGVPFGSTLEPNSDRVTLKVKIRPLETIDVDFVGSFIRHGNVNEDLDDFSIINEYITGSSSYVNDGSIANPSKNTSAGNTNLNRTPFLTQGTIQYVVQLGFDARCRLPILKTGGYMTLKLSYRFEVNINGDVGTNIYSNTLAGTSSSTEQVQAEAERQLAAWRESVTGTEINNYASVGFEFFY